jgi:arsenite methyltransferase
MADYLSYKFEDSPEFVNTFDELPLWSAHFGILLLKHLEYKHNLTILDIGSGAGFPLMEIAARFGNSCKCYGLDPWANANNRAKQKIRNYGLENVEMMEGSAEKIPLDDSSIDLIVSNLGINNFENPTAVFAECSRVLKPKGTLALTTNLDGHWIEFYNIFETTLKQLNKDDLVAKLTEQQRHRGTVESISTLFTANGFEISRHYRENFEMKFVDGTAFLNHYFIKLGWLSSWLELAAEDAKQIFATLEDNLNRYAGQQNGLSLTVPMAFIEGVLK